jgi:lipopolysaccharide biosynthesis glycosyltransferase
VKTGCVCYVIDSAYLFPTLVSSIQARQNVPVELADVVIVCIGARCENGAIAEEVATKFGVSLRFVPRDAVEHLHIMFGRLFLSNFFGDQYRRVVYIDGDTQVAASLAPLFDVDIPTGRFLACRDPAGLFADLSSRWRGRVSEERRAIGYNQAFNRYFNSGVLVVDMATWPALADECLATIRRLGESMKYPDQDILNLAVGDRCSLIANRWNFPGFLIGTVAEQRVAPHIYHFMSNPRPWKQQVAPWGAKWTQPYRALLADHPSLATLTPRPEIRMTPRYVLQQFYKGLVEYRRVAKILEAAPDLEV